MFLYNSVNSSNYVDKVSYDKLQVHDPISAKDNNRSNGKKQKSVHCKSPLCEPCVKDNKSQRSVRNESSFCEHYVRNNMKGSQKHNGPHKKGKMTTYNMSPIFEHDIKNKVDTHSVNKNQSISIRKYVHNVYNESPSCKDIHNIGKTAEKKANTQPRHGVSKNQLSTHGVGREQITCIEKYVFDKGRQPKRDGAVSIELYGPAVIGKTHETGGNNPTTRNLLNNKSG